MTVTTANIIPIKQVENVQTTQYTSANSKTIIDKFTVTNVSANVVTFGLNIVPSGGLVGTSNLIIPNKSIAPSEVYQCPELIGHVLENGTFISTIASAAASLNMDVSGRIIT